MRILVTSVTRNRKGQPVRADRDVEGEMIRLGRGTQCEIHLPDPRVALFHAAIYRQGDSIFIHAPEAELAVDGGAEREARLTPRVHVALGPYEMTVEPPPSGYDLALSIELVRSLPDDLEEIKAKSRTSLEETVLSKRGPAWILAIVLAIVFLAVPAINALLPPLRQVTAKLPVTPDQAWNPGALSAGHQAFGHQCASCHETPFVHVRDHVCIECHVKTPGHVQTVALQSKLFGGTRCANCHADHKGPDALVRRDPDLCVTCHGSLKIFDAGTTLANVSDFAVNHPPFKLSLWKGPKSGDVVRVSQTDKANLIEQSHLKFPHDLHLKTSVRGPKGRRTLECRSCHVPDASGKGFEPIVMKTACIECHTLEFEPAVTTRQVPHGSVDDVMLTMQEFYANIALNNIPVDVVDIGEIRRGLPRLGTGIITEQQRQLALTWAKAKAQQVSEDLFEARVCIVCHEVTQAVIQGESGSEVAWGVASVHVASTWMPKASFDHAKHRTNKCADCHDVEKSKSSADIAIPTIERCRDCHAGNRPAANKVVSTCVSCHDFHLAGHPAFGVRADASPGGLAGAILGARADSISRQQQ
jgi:predicted CXXCH cytochrome family protein